MFERGIFRYNVRIIMGDKFLQKPPSGTPVVDVAERRAQQLVDRRVALMNFDPNNPRKVV